MRKVNLKIPQRYDQLTVKQLEYVAWLFLTEPLKNEFLTKAFIKLSGLKIMSEPLIIDDKYNKLVQYVRLKGEKPFIISIEEISSMALKLEWLQNIDECNPVRWIKMHARVNNKLYGITFRQYFTAENYYLAYSETKKDEYLNALVASLYTRPWEKFSDHKVRKRAKRFTSINKARKYSVFLFYGGIRVFLKRQYPHLFVSGSNKGKIDMKEQLHAQLRALSKGNITENDRILNSPVHDALSELNALLKEHEEMKKKLKQNKNTK